MLPGSCPIHRVCARDASGEVCSVELDGHPYFIATLFQADAGLRRAGSHEHGNSQQVTEMADEGDHIHHEIDYVEFAMLDMAGAKRFYAAAFGWDFNDYGPDYAGIRKRAGGEAGGFRLQPEVTAGGPLVILYSADLDTTLARVREAGGQVVQETFEFPGGRRFHFKDPSGNELAVWSDR